MSYIPHPMDRIPNDTLDVYAKLRHRIEAGELITYYEGEEIYQNDMLWDDAWSGHERTEEPGEGWYAADCRADNPAEEN